MNGTRTRPFLGSTYLRWVQPLHDRGLFWLICRDCRWLRSARRTPENGPYDHDLPRWRQHEVFVDAEHDWLRDREAT